MVSQLTDSTSVSDYFDFVSRIAPKSIWESIKHPAWDNQFTILFSVWIAMFILEHVLPKNKNYSVIGRKGFFLDLFYLFFIDFLFLVIGFVAVTYTVEYAFTGFMKWLGVTLPLIDPSFIPTGLQFLIFFIIVDFFEFFAHFLLHRVNFFWRFHKIHHAQETLGFASTRHFHFMEYLVLKPLTWIPFGLLGLSDDKYLWFSGIYLWIGLSLTFFSHCNVKVNFGFLNKIIITPNTHYWHHAKNIPRKYGVNYASVLVIWDYLFKSFYLPEDPKLQPILGVPDNDVPNNFLGQVWHPFKELFARKKDSQMLIPKEKRKKIKD